MTNGSLQSTRRNSCYSHTHDDDGQRLSLKFQTPFHLTSMIIACNFLQKRAVMHSWVNDINCGITVGRQAFVFRQKRQLYDAENSFWHGCHFCHRDQALSFSILCLYVPWEYIITLNVINFKFVVYYAIIKLKGVKTSNALTTYIHCRSLPCLFCSDFSNLN